MFCPNCGGRKFETLFGGMCSKSCVYCGKAVQCKDRKTGVIEKDSILTKNPLWAIILRILYNRIPGNRAKGRENIKKHEAFNRRVKENMEIIKDLQKRRETIVTMYSDMKIVYHTEPPWPRKIKINDGEEK